VNIVNRTLLRVLQGSMSKKQEKIEVVCLCLEKAMSHIGESNDMMDIYFCRLHNKIRKLPKQPKVKNEDH
jgi:hypothetical protein